MIIPGLKKEPSEEDLLAAFFAGYKHGFDECQFQAAFDAAKRHFKKFEITPEEVKEIWEEFYGAESSE